MPNANQPLTNDVSIAQSGNVDHTAGLNEDHLGFQPYVQAIYSYLKNEETKAPFTISIEGNWGSGKSSFMKQLSESLEKDKLPTIKFNAWRHDKVETMWAAFALHFIKEMRSKLGFRESIGADFALWWKRFQFSKGWFPLLKTIALFVLYGWVAYQFIANAKNLPTDLVKEEKLNWSALFTYLGTTGLIIAPLFFFKKISEVLGDPFRSDLQKFVNKPNYEGSVAFIEEFHRDFDLVVSVLSGDHTKVYVFIDDLDRADIPKSAELMQGLHMLISENSKLIFIIGMDREKVAAGIAAKHKDLLPYLDPSSTSSDEVTQAKNALSYGFRFLEKFIQLSFSIPQASPIFTREFIDSLSEADERIGDVTPIEYHPVLTIKGGKDSVQLKEVTALMSPFFDDNPRRIKQYVNIFRLKAHIAFNTGLFNDEKLSGKKPLTIPQLGKFIALYMLVPDFIEYCRSSKTVFNQTGKTEDDKAWRGHPVVAKIVAAEPKGSDSFDKDYDMTFFDVRPLLETSPAMQPTSTVSPITTTTTVLPSSQKRDPDTGKVTLTVNIPDIPASGNTRNAPTPGPIKKPANTKISNGQQSASKKK